jgi:hypothetical protein
MASVSMGIDTQEMRGAPVGNGRVCKIAGGPGGHPPGIRNSNSTWEEEL